VKHGGFFQDKMLGSVQNGAVTMRHDYDTESLALTIGARRLTLLRVKNLEQYVDREALLRDEIEEPPYWAHLWTGALTLARYVEDYIDCKDLQVLDLGCGLGLTGVIAALKGGRVTFADREPDALSFATLNAQLNNCLSFEAKVLDFTKDEMRQKFSLMLGAEILYDRPTFPALVDFLARHLSPGGSAVLADARRTNTEEFYRQLDRAGLRWWREDIAEREDTLPLLVSIVTIQR
jgi:predicted nicotinamide N-methyase